MGVGSKLCTFICCSSNEDFRKRGAAPDLPTPLAFAILATLHLAKRNFPEAMRVAKEDELQLWQCVSSHLKRDSKRHLVALVRGTVTTQKSRGPSQLLDFSFFSKSHCSENLAGRA